MIIRVKREENVSVIVLQQLSPSTPHWNNGCAVRFNEDYQSIFLNDGYTYLRIGC
jgi:hypothetical protein